MKTMRVWILLAALAFPLAGCPGGDNENTGATEPEAEAAAAQLAVELVRGDAKQAGSLVTYAVRINGGPSAIKAFGLDVTFDPAALRYAEWATGALTGAFTHLGANQVADGTLRIGGFTVDDPIPAGAEGSLVELQFEVVSEAPETLAIAEAVDDVSTFSTAAP